MRKKRLMIAIACIILVGISLALFLLEMKSSELTILS